MSRNVEQIVQEALGAQALTICRLQAELEAAQEIAQREAKNAEDALQQLGKAYAQRDEAIKLYDETIALVKRQGGQPWPA